MKRSDRLISLTRFFLEHPHELTRLSTFTERYDASKSSISEDVNIIHTMFEQEGIGSLHRYSGSSGGVSYIPYYSKKDSTAFIEKLCNTLEDPDRILPGGYLYMSDLLGDPQTIRKIGQAFVSAFSNQTVEAVVTVETKGIPLAYAVAAQLDVPVVIIRRNMQITEGPSVSINYVSGRSKRIQTMVLPKRFLNEGMNVCIIDDFMKGGGTVSGMVSLLEDEFHAKVVGIGVLAEAQDEENEQMVEEYTSLIKVSHIEMDKKRISIEKGNYFSEES
ncbi:MAG TPA: pur operon repressor [Pseudogracilibacillus sp.]|nr:pur operon repressor [Pseudogracilibacillus sp.]